MNTHKSSHTDGPHRDPHVPESAVVIGAGPDGLTAAWALAAHGVKVSVFDRAAISPHAKVTLRRMLLRSAAVRMVGRADVVDLLTSAPSRVARGVVVLARGLHAIRFPVDLVVDATGGVCSFYVSRG